MPGVHFLNVSKEVPCSTGKNAWQGVLSGLSFVCVDLALSNKPIHILFLLLLL
jgi:hypothetical protein